MTEDLKVKRKRKPPGIIMDLLKLLPSGYSFYTENCPKAVQSYCSLYKVKAITDIVLVVSDYTKPNPAVTKITRVTIL